MIPPEITGTIELSLIGGIHADKVALIAIDANRLYGASDTETKEEINIEEIELIDIERAINGLIEGIKYYGK